MANRTEMLKADREVRAKPIGELTSNAGVLYV